MEAHLQKLEDEEAMYNREMNSANALIKELHQERIDSAYNVDYMLWIKQGSVEVEQAAVVTDYGNSLLIPKSIVQSLNEKIRKAADENIQCLKDIRDFRKKVRILEWFVVGIQIQTRSILEYFPILFSLVLVSSFSFVFFPLSFFFCPFFLCVCVGSCYYFYLHYLNNHGRELDKLELDEERFTELKNEYYLLRMTKNMQEFLKGSGAVSQDALKQKLLSKKESMSKVRWFFFVFFIPSLG